MGKDRVKKRLEEYKEIRKEATALENVLDFLKKNAEKCNGAFSYYEGFLNNSNSFVGQPVRTTAENLNQAVNGNAILVITANPIEKGVFLRRLSEVTKQKLNSFFLHKHVYQIVPLANNTIVHVHADGIGDELTRRAINAAYKVFKNKIQYIVLLGICYGIDSSKQSLGQVILSNKVIGYRINFRDDSASDEIKFETNREFDEAPENTWLYTLQTCLSYYQFKNNILHCLNDNIINVDLGFYLSSNSLMSSRKVKHEVVNSVGAMRPRPSGGEMEGCGIFKTNIFEETDEHFKKWIIIKGICDWGEAKNLLNSNKKINDKKKDSIQAYAMTNVVEMFIQLLNVDGIF